MIETKKQIIVDTDIGCDCDDGAAIGMLNQYILDGECEALCITQCTSVENGAKCIDVINEFYGNDIPVGTMQNDDFISDEKFDHYATKLVKKFGVKKDKIYYDAIKLIRNKLAKADNNSVSFITIGPFRNMCKLFFSQPDEISPLSGRDLFNIKVKEVFCMACAFSDRAKKERHCEYNVVMDVSSFKEFVNGCEKPMFFLDFDNGVKVTVGETFADYYDVNPVACSYKEFGNRPSWDPLTVMACLDSDRSWFDYERGKLKLYDDGYTEFEKTATGNHYKINIINAKRAKEKIEEKLKMQKAGD